MIPFERILKTCVLCALATLLVGTPTAVGAKGKSKGGPSMTKGLKRVGAPPLSSRAAKNRVKRTRWEPRPRNAKANRTVPTRRQIRYFRSNSDMPNARWVNGRMTGSTDDIIEWAAIKWGLPKNVLRAVAVHETWWDNNFVGDQGDSFGIFQVRRPYHCCLPFMRGSTAFNADYYGGIIRAYYDGKQSWLNNPDVAPDNGKTYRAGDLWGSVGAWYSGRWWTDGNRAYVRAVKKHARQKTWRSHPYFDEK